MINWGGRKYIPANTQRNNRQNISERDRLEDLLRPLGEKKYNTNTWIANVFKEPESAPTPPPFTPSSLGDLQLWFDADDTATLGIVGGIAVDTWTSKGIVDVVLSASTPARRAGYTTSGGQGSSAAVVLFSSSTATNRSGLLSFDYSKTFDCTLGYTYFVMGKNVSSKTANKIYNQSGLLNMWNTASTNSYGAKLFSSTQRTIFDYLQTGATSGALNSYSNYPNASAFTQASDYVLNSLVVDYADLYPGKNYGKNIISGNTINSSLTLSGMTTYTGKTLNAFGLASTNLGSESNTNLSNFEVYEILLYNKVLSSSQINQVENYLRDKWEYTADTSNLAVVNLNYTGKTNQSAQYIRALASPSSQVNAQMVWDNFNDRVILPVDNTITFDNSPLTLPVGIVYTLKDGSNNTILSQVCDDTTDKTITLSAGTYTFDGQIVYDCVPPTPSPTPTMTITPSVTPTFTPTPSFTPTPFFNWADVFFNLTGDATSRFALIKNSNSQVYFDISGVTTTGFTLNLPPEDFTIIYENSAGNYMNFEGYFANCGTGLPTSLAYSNYCVSVNNQTWGMGYNCYYFNMFADQASCP